MAGAGRPGALRAAAPGGCCHGRLPGRRVPAALPGHHCMAARGRSLGGTLEGPRRRAPRLLHPFILSQTIIGVPLPQACRRAGLPACWGGAWARLPSQLTRRRGAAASRARRSGPRRRLRPVGVTPLRLQGALQPGCPQLALRHRCCRRCWPGRGGPHRSNGPLASPRRRRLLLILCLERLPLLGHRAGTGAASRLQHGVQLPDASLVASSPLRGVAVGCRICQAQEGVPQVLDERFPAVRGGQRAPRCRCSIRHSTCTKHSRCVHCTLHTPAQLAGGGGTGGLATSPVLQHPGLRLLHPL